MSLNKVPLRDELRDVVLNNPSIVPVDTASAWATAYANYAAFATGGTCGVPVGSLVAAKATLISTLSAVMIPTSELSASADAFAAGFTAFWLTPPVTVGAGAVTAVGGTAVLKAALITYWSVTAPALFSVGGPTYQQAADFYADTLDVFTKTVVVAGPGPCGGTLV